MAPAAKRATRTAWSASCRLARLQAPIQAARGAGKENKLRCPHTARRTWNRARGRAELTISQAVRLCLLTRFAAEIFRRGYSGSLQTPSKIDRLLPSRTNAAPALPTIYLRTPDESTFDTGSPVVVGQCGRPGPSVSGSVTKDCVWGGRG
jgi:hypothetical protein